MMFDEGKFYDPEAVDKSELNNSESKDMEDFLPKEQGEVISKRLGKLWKKFAFKGNPPKPGSPVEKRLFDTCDKYTNFAINMGLANVPSSDKVKRELHNQIALMVASKQRTIMLPHEAEEIADFACQFSRGFPLAEALL